MLTGSAWCIANFNSADGTARSQRKGAAKENAPVIAPVRTKARWTQVQGRPNTIHDAASQDALFRNALSKKSPVNSSPRVRTERKVAAKYDASFKNPGQDTAKSKAGAV
jgi:hypothetical protein